MARVLIIGGSDAGISAALRARELDSAVEVTVLLADGYPNFSICGLPYYLSGDVADWRSLAHRSVAELEHAGIELLLEHRVEEVDATTHTVLTAGAVTGTTGWLSPSVPSRCVLPSPASSTRGSTSCTRSVTPACSTRCLRVGPSGR